MKQKNIIFKFTTKYTDVAPDNKTIAPAVEVKFSKDPYNLVCCKETMIWVSAEFTKYMLTNFSEVTISYFNTGMRIELLPHQNADKEVIDLAGVKVEKMIAKIIEKLAAEREDFKGKPLLLDTDATSKWSTISVVDDI